jgi:protein-tyrosine phosphatase
MKNSRNIQPTINPKPITVERVWVRTVNHDESERQGRTVYYAPTFDGFLRKQPLQ